MSALNPILLKGYVYEIRAPKTGRQGTISGYFDDSEKLYQAVQQFDGKVAGLYSTLNPVNPALLARANNRIVTNAKATTSDADIERRCWVLVDCDAIRPAEISATDSEHQAALERAIKTQKWLSEQEWPDPIVADSGNGAHLLYRIDLPNADESTELVKAILEVLALQFDDGKVKVDTAVYNAARICRLYGTLSCKGDSTSDRPHRRSEILSVPAGIMPVPEESLKGLAALRPADPKPNRYQQQRTAGYLDARGFLERHGLEVTREKDWKDAIVYQLERFPFNPEHHQSSHVIQFNSGGRSFGCFHNSCQGNHWQELRELLAPNRTSQAGPKSHSPELMRGDFTLVTADKVTMKSVKWLMAGRVPLCMLTLMAGRGGLAKSTIAIDWAAQVTMGKAAGALAGEPAHVIISSTEDTEEETLKPRLTAANADTSRVHFIHLHRAGLDGSLTIPEDIDILRAAIQESNAKFVIIDPLMSHLSETLNSWNDHEIRRALTPLSRLAEELKVAILVIAHLNKDSKKEAIDRIGGSVGISNAARSVLFAGPDPTDPEGKFKMLSHPKCNVGAEQPTLRYRTEPVILFNGEEPIETTKIVWEGEAPGITAEDLVARPDAVSREDRESAAEWLEKVLPVGVRKKQTDIETEAKKAGISQWVLKRAKPILKVQSKKQGFNPGDWWWWREASPNNTSALHPSEKNCTKPSKNVNKAEGSIPAPSAHSSASEGSSKSAAAPFVHSSHISTRCVSSSPQGSSALSYIEQGVIDLDVD